MHLYFMEEIQNFIPSLSQSLAENSNSNNKREDGIKVEINCQPKYFITTWELNKYCHLGFKKLLDINRNVKICYMFLDVAILFHNPI